MGKIGYGYGSEWHLLRYLGYHRDCLDDTILQATGGNQIKWLDFRFSSVNKALQHDREWQGIEYINDPDVLKKWKKFWPQTGNPPNWDAVGKLVGSQGEEWLLVEAKAHLEELHSSCAATLPKSIRMIQNAMRATQKAFDSKAQIAQWHSPYYQFCNRLAVLHFLLHECGKPIPAHLVFIYFYGDKIGNMKCPKNAEDWDAALEKMYAVVGLDIKSELLQRVHHVFLPVVKHPCLQS
jgi:hypothetical protein